MGYKIADVSGSEGYSSSVMIFWEEHVVSGRYDRTYGTMLDVIA
jgi:hypothetical protein